ncbi:MAG: response regulator [Deltaproteobacteria bacterium]|nr:MAG: response regulator [Deltaproteobacteria bacterium]
MAGGSTSSWADAVAATLERLDVADTIEELRHHIDELIGRLAEAEGGDERPRERGDTRGSIDEYIEQLGRKVEAANDLLSEVADVLEAQTERIETIEQQLGDPDAPEPSRRPPAQDGEPPRADADLVAAIGELSELLAARFDRLENRLSGLESRLDDVLAIAGERQRQIEELEERLLILVAAGPGAAETAGAAAPEASVPRWPGGVRPLEASGDAEASGGAGVSEQPPGEHSPPRPSAPLEPPSSEASAGFEARAVAKATGGNGPALQAALTASEADPVARDTRLPVSAPPAQLQTGTAAGVRGNGGSDPRIEQLVEKAVSATREFAPGAVLSTSRPGWRKTHPTVLVVDDVPDARMILSVYLSKTGYQVVTAASAEDCLAKLLHHDVDAIVLDVRMPGADGRHVCQVLAEDPAYAGKKDTPVIVYTGYPEEYGREEVLGWGASDYVVKGGDMLPLITALVRHTQPCAEQHA